MTTRYSGRLDLSKMPDAVTDPHAIVLQPTPLPPRPSFVSLPGGRIPSLMRAADAQLDALLDTHQWITARSRTVPDEELSRAVTLPD